MEQTDWKVRIDSPISRFGIDIWIYRRLTNGKTEILQGGNEPSTTIIEYGAADSSLAPTLRLDGGVDKELLQALVKYGVKLPEQSFLEGKLEATEKHLADMRKLAKLK